MEEKNSGRAAWAEIPPSPRWHSSKRRGRFGLELIAALAVLILLSSVSNIRLFSFGSRGGPNGTDSSNENPLNPWESITLSEELEWHSCYGMFNPRFKCARLTVPMDYNRPLGESRTNPKVHIALVLLPAQESPATQTPPKSPMLINPGGPGGSGVALVLLLGPSIQKIFGADQPVIGFDPRGVSYTTPRADCWAKPPACDGCPEDAVSGMMHRLEWENMNAVFGSLNSSNVALKYLEAGHRAVNDLCRSKDAQLGSRSILGHASTAHVARDMVSIVDAWDRWAEGKGLPPSPLRGKLVYWGFSYGTYLGATFAKMFPDRVGRMLLDGVVDAEYYVSPVWKESLLDTDNVLRQFFAYCVEAGRRCDLYRGGDTAAAVRRRYDAIMDRLESTPVTFTHPENFFPVILRAEHVKTIVFGMLYSPVQGFPVIASLLNWIDRGQVERLGELFQDTSLMCTLPGSAAVAFTSADAQRAIMCSDKTQPVNLTLPEIASAYEAMASTSQFADIWMNLMMKCNGWDINTPHPTPDGHHPWAATSHINSDNQHHHDQIETSFPLLFLSSTHDPVTPLHAAVKMALRFRRAGLLEQLSDGHCTMAAASRCTARAARAYVRRGEVPPPPKIGKREAAGEGREAGEWLRCGADEGPWGIVKHRAGSGSGSEWVDGVVEVDEEEEEEGMMQAWREVQRVVQASWGTVDGRAWTAGVDKLVHRVRLGADRWARGPL